MKISEREKFKWLPSVLVSIGIILIMIHVACMVGSTQGHKDANATAKPAAETLEEESDIRRQALLLLQIFEQIKPVKQTSFAPRARL